MVHQTVEQHQPLLQLSKLEFFSICYKEFNCRVLCFLFSPPTAAPTTAAQTNQPTAAQTTTARPSPSPVQTTSASSVSSGTWSSSSVQYRVGDVVVYNGVQYRCIFNHTSYSGAEPGIYTWAWWQRL